MVIQQAVRIRDLKPGDMGEILEIEYRCFPDPYPLSLLNHLYETHPDGFLVAELDGKVVGYVIGVMRWGSNGHIIAIAVDPPYRRRRIGAELMGKIMQRLRSKGARVVRLEVRKGNLPAQRFYSSLGFRSGEEIPFYYEDGETAIVMTYEF